MFLSAPATWGSGRGSPRTSVRAGPQRVPRLGDPPLPLPQAQAEALLPSPGYEPSASGMEGLGGVPGEGYALRTLKQTAPCPGLPVLLGWAQGANPSQPGPRRGPWGGVCGWPGPKQVACSFSPSLSPPAQPLRHPRSPLTPNPLPMAAGVQPFLPPQTQSTPKCSLPVLSGPNTQA